jgi:hypothetical protein
MVIIAMFFFFICHSRFLPYLLVGRFSIPIPYILCLSLLQVVRPPPRPFHLTFTDIHNNIYTPMGALPDGTRTRADLAVVVERPPPYRQPRGDIHKHPWPGGGSFFGKNPPPSVRFELTSIGTATSEYFLRQPCGHRAIAMLMDYNSTRN